MNLTSCRKFAIAATLTLFPVSLLAQTSSTMQNQKSGASWLSNSTSPAAKHEAMKMVKARAQLMNLLDAKKLQPGANFQAELDKTVHLDNGPKLPGGTILKGTVEADDMNVSGNSKLVLRFSSAQLKDGQTLPIKATIVGLYKPGDDSAGSWYDMDTPPPNTWNNGTLAVDQLGVESGVDLHSKIASRNSGVFVTTSKDDVKLPRGSDINLALAAASGSQQRDASQNGSSTRHAGN